MSIELYEIEQHMARFEPFSRLPAPLLQAVANAVEISYFKAGEQILTRDQPLEHVCYIRSGAVELYQRDGTTLFNRLGEGDLFGYTDLARKRAVRYPVTAIEDSLIYYIDAATFEQVADECEEFAEFVDVSGRLKHVFEQQRQSSPLLSTKARQLVQMKPLLATASMSLSEAASMMQEQHVTCVLVTEPCDSTLPLAFLDDEDHPVMLVGIVTDRDMCTRVVAEAISPQASLREIMTSRRIITTQASDSAYEAMLKMLDERIQHLPILNGKRPIGVLQLADLLRFETSNNLFLINTILRQPSTEGLVRLSQDVRRDFVSMVEQQSGSDMISRALSLTGRAFVHRLCELAEEQFGPPPVPYAMMVLGSMAREEVTITSDQDHALIIADSYQENLHGDYFKQLANFVSDHMAECGYAYCSGDVMASNTKWRQPLSVWRHYFSDWIATPTPEHLLESSIFFDLACAHGEESFVQELRELIAQQASNNPRFLAALARNANNRTPPLGFFRTFVMEQDGAERRSINLKRRGTAPLSDVIRVHALACGSTQQSTLGRLDDIAHTQLITTEMIKRLRYAFEYLSTLRINHQAAAISQGEAPDNSVEPDTFSRSERHNLREAFETLRDAQKFLGFRYPLKGNRERHS